MSLPFTGAVLAGGASRRMGRDKALVEVVPGRPLVQVGAEALRGAGALDVLVVGGDVAALAALGLRAVPDLHPGEGPLGGIVTALRAAPTDVVVVLACDVPGVVPAVPAALVAALATDPGAGVALALVGEREQPLTAAWRRSVVLTHLEEAFAAGERAPRRVLDRVPVVEVDGLPAEALRDVDSPDDLRRYAEAPPAPTTRTGPL